MPDKKISELVNLTSLATDDEFVVVDADANATKRITVANLLADYPSNAEIGDGSDISMNSDGDGQLMIDGSGYTGAIALDGSAMHVYHNSSGRDLVFGTNETARLKITAAGEIVAARGTAWDGTVSQNGESHVIERDSNANGEYIRFADGTQICFRSDTSGSMNQSYGNNFIGEATSPAPNWPIAFSSVPWVAGSAGRDASAPAWLGTARNPTTTAVPQAWAVSPISTGDTAFIDWIAIGRWY